ncbi:hypothetical protein JW916_01300, partial [Candidatus Sumerlaeota bacterium]|nr:hypothetical protein [Candidatus Sumerlaeota bacterium]
GRQPAGRGGGQSNKGTAQLEQNHRPTDLKSAVAKNRNGKGSSWNDGSHPLAIGVEDSPH